MNQNLEDCYFYIDADLPEDQQKVNPICLKCHENHPDLGWLWEGSKLGYGPYDFICSKCGYVIHSVDDKIKEE